MPISPERSQTHRLIVESLAAATARVPDLTPAVYDRLFALRPESRKLFRADPSNAIKRSMLELSVDAIVDFTGERKAAHRLILCEVQSHDCYGTTPELFCEFFKVIADEVRATIKDEWSEDHQAAWDQVVEELLDYTAEGVRQMA